MPQETSLPDVIELLAMLMATGVMYGWVCRRIVGWPPAPTPPGSKTILRLVPRQGCDTEGSEVSSSRQAA